MIFANETFVEEHRTKFKWTVFGIVFMDSEEADDKTFEYKIRTPTFLLSKDTRQLYSDIYSPPADVDGKLLQFKFSLGEKYPNIKTTIITSIFVSSKIVMYNFLPLASLTNSSL